MDPTLLDASAVDPEETHRAAPTLRNLLAALSELEGAGRLAYEFGGIRPLLDAERAAAEDAVDRALAVCPEVRRFLGLMLIARESRLRRDRGSRPRRRRGGATP